MNILKLKLQKLTKEQLAFVVIFLLNKGVSYDDMIRFCLIYGPDQTDVSITDLQKIIDDETARQVASAESEVTIEDENKMDLLIKKISAREEALENSRKS
jgi:hypothetical protein